MKFCVAQKLTVVHAQPDGLWLKVASEKIERGENFLVLEANSPDLLAQLRDLCHWSCTVHPKRLTRAQIFQLSPFLSPMDFQNLFSHSEDTAAIYFIEQMDLPGATPPRLRPVLVYCPIRGILSQHEDIFEASRTYEEHMQTLPRHHPERSLEIYRWQGKDWYFVANQHRNRS